MLYFLKFIVLPKLYEKILNQILCSYRIFDNGSSVVTKRSVILIEYFFREV